MSLTNVRFLKLGSDPEFIFGKEEDEMVTPVSANETLKLPNTVLTGTKIGTDGHNYTGELRPDPAHNVRLLLHNVGVLIHKTALFCAKKKNNLSMFAVPFIRDEALGGHIHASFLAGRDLSAQVFGASMNFFLAPLEMWFPSPPLRRARFAAYSPTGENAVRAQNFGKEEMSDGRYYFHLEYRVPSTWLAHPAVAYVYLALAKLVMLNLNNIPHGDLRVSWSSRNAEELLWERLDERYAGLRKTPDLLELPKALAFLRDNRRDLTRAYKPINVAAWRKVILPTQEQESEG